MATPSPTVARKVTKFSILAFVKIEFYLTVDNTGQLQFKDNTSVDPTTLPMSPFHSCRREAKLRQSACLLYQSSSLEEVFLKLDVEVESRRLSMRLDQTIYSDVGLRQQLIELLNSYNVSWLMLGVEVCSMYTVVLNSTMNLWRYI